MNKIILAFIKHVIDSVALKMIPPKRIIRSMFPTQFIIRKNQPIHNIKAIRNIATAAIAIVTKSCLWWIKLIYVFHELRIVLTANHVMTSRFPSKIGKIQTSLQYFGDKSPFWIRARAWQSEWPVCKGGIKYESRTFSSRPVKLNETGIGDKLSTIFGSVW